MTEPTAVAVDVPVAVTVNLPRSDALMAPAERALASARQFVIDSPMLFEEAGIDLQAIERRKRDLDDLRKKLVQPFSDAVKAANALFKEPIEAYDEASTVLRRAMLGYQQAEQRKAEEIRRAAEAAAAAERQRLAEEAAAAQARADAEAAELREKAAAAAVAGKIVLAAKLESRADSREQAGAAVAAAATMQAHAVIAAIVPQAPAPKAAGIATTKRWTAEVTDKLALIRYVAEHPEYASYLEVNEAALRQFATATRGAAEIPGVRIHQAEALAVRSRR